MNKKLVVFGLLAVLALVGVVIGGLALAPPNSRFGTASGRLGAIVALVAGLIAVVNGGLVLAIANGGPGTGNGVVGGAAAMVLGLMVPPANGSFCLGSENQPAGRRPAMSVRICVVRSMRAFSSSRVRALTSSCLKPCAAIVR